MSHDAIIFDLDGTLWDAIPATVEGWNLDLFLKFSHLRPFFKDVYCNGISGLSKGEMLLGLKNQYSLQNPVYIGDTEGDWKAARHAAVSLIFVEYGFGSVAGNVKKASSFEQLVHNFK